MTKPSGPTGQKFVIFYFCEVGKNTYQKVSESLIWLKPAKKHGSKHVRSIVYSTPLESLSITSKVGIVNIV